jgi:hypothetical protein
MYGLGDHKPVSVPLHVELRNTTLVTLPLISLRRSAWPEERHKSSKNSRKNRERSIKLGEFTAAWRGTTTDSVDSIGFIASHFRLTVKFDLSSKTGRGTRQRKRRIE